MFDSIPETLFWLGTGLTVLVGGASLFGGGEVRRDVVALPFLLFLAAAVAKYLGL